MGLREQMQIHAPEIKQSLPELEKFLQGRKMVVIFSWVLVMLETQIAEVFNLPANTTTHLLMCKELDETVSHIIKLCVVTELMAHGGVKDVSSCY